MPGRVSSPLAAALAAAATIEACPACTEPANSGLCHSDACRRAVLPRDVRSPLRDAHSGMYHELVQRLGESGESAAVRKARRRDQRKEQRRRARLGIALAGGFARVTTARAAA